MPIFNVGLFSGSPELVLADFFIGVALTIFVGILPVILAIMITQRS